MVKTLPANAGDIRHASSISETMRKKKEIHASFSASPESAKVIGKEGVKCLVKMEKASNLYNKIFWDGERPHSHNFHYSILL